MLADPFKDLGKAEFMALHRAIDECVLLGAFDLDVKAVPAQEDIGGSEGDALIPVKEAMIIGERFHQRGGLFFNGIVVADLRTKNGSLNNASIANTMQATEQLDEAMLHPVDFRYRKVLRHLLGETLQ